MIIENAKELIVSSKVNELEELQIELSTTDTDKVDAFASYIMAKTIDSWNCGLVIERFIGTGTSTVIVTKDVQVGMVEELNIDELMGVEPLEPRPIFEQSFDLNDNAYAIA